METASLLERLVFILKLSAILLEWPKSLFGVGVGVWCFHYLIILLFPDIMVFPRTKLL